MTRTLTFRPADRLLVFAPHPDDETLATGELIQLAAAAGAAVRVVFATDGDNNPWPQRWCERRLRIGAAERERWGRRRRGEALAALATLGVDSESTRFLGWPDLGLTGMLERNPETIDALRAEIEAFAPTHIAMPSIGDRHPDHGALRVMLELALKKSRANAVRLGYTVHGREPDASEWRLPLDAERHWRKREALRAHASQISLSRGRLERWADADESFEYVEAAAPAASEHVGLVLRMPLQPPQRFWRRHDVLLVLADGDRIESARVPLPRVFRPAIPRTLASLHGGRVGVELEPGAVMIRIHGRISGYVKLERCPPRLLIFDVETWKRFEDVAALHEPAAPRVGPVPVAQRAPL